MWSLSLGIWGWWQWSLKIDLKCHLCFCFVGLRWYKLLLDKGWSLGIDLKLEPIFQFHNITLLFCSASRISLFLGGGTLSWWHPTPVLLPGKSHGQRGLVGCTPWGHEESDTTERLPFHFSFFMHWRRKWQLTPVFLPGESQGRGSMVGCHQWGHAELDTTEVT